MKLNVVWGFVILLGCNGMLLWYINKLEHELAACRADQSTPHE